MGIDEQVRAERVASDAWGRQLGLEILKVTEEPVHARLDAAPQHDQPYGILHGGVSKQTDFLRSRSEGELTVEGRLLQADRSQHLRAVVIRRSCNGRDLARGQVRSHVLDTLSAERAAAG